MESRHDVGEKNIVQEEREGEESAAIRELARKRAVAKVRDVLSVPEGLKRIDSLCAQMERSKGGVAMQLKATADAHLGAAAQSINAIGRAISTIGTVQEGYAQLDELCSECSELLADSDYAVIQKLELVRENVRSTLEQVQAVQEIPEKVALLRAELESSTRCLNAIHRQLVGLERFAENAEVQMKEHAEMREVLEEPMALVKDLCKEFERALVETFRGTVALAETSPWVLVRANQAVERQEMLDSEKKGVNARKWGELRMKALQESIDKRFEIVLDNLPEEVVESSQFVTFCDSLLDDLFVIFDKGAACFPPEIRVFEMFVESYHKHFYSEFESFGRDKHKNMPNSAIVAILQWVFSDYQMRLMRLGVGKLDPPIERSLLTLESLYNKHIAEKMFDWVPEVIKNSRVKRPVLVEGQLFTTAPVDLFDIMNAQLAVARSTGSQMLSTRISSVISSGIIAFCQNLIADVSGDKWRDMDISVMIATVNDANHCIELTDGIEDNIIEPLSGDDRLTVDFEPARTELRNLMDAYQDAIVRCIFDDVAKVTEDLFTSHWIPEGIEELDEDNEIESESEPISQILECFKDYLYDNLKPCMLGFFVTRICSKLLDLLVYRYIEELVTKRHPASILNTAGAAELMGKDREAIRDFFGEQCGIKTGALDPQIDLLMNVCALFSGDGDMFMLSVYDLTSQYKDFSMDIVEAALSSRNSGSSSLSGYFDKERLQDTQESSLKRFREGSGKDPKTLRTFFSRLPKTR